MKGKDIYFLQYDIEYINQSVSIGVGVCTKIGLFTTGMFYFLASFTMMIIEENTHLIIIISRLVFFSVSAAHSYSG
jgi:hypothetical protein